MRPQVIDQADGTQIVLLPEGFLEEGAIIEIERRGDEVLLKPCPADLEPSSADTGSAAA